MTNQFKETVAEGDDTPRGLREGFGSLDHASTPMIMRDCLADHYVDHPTAENLFKAAGRIASDLKRRSHPEDSALTMILSHVTAKLKHLKRGQHKSIEAAVRWVYHKQENGPSCTGALLAEGLCFLESGRQCHYHNEEAHIRQAKKIDYSVGIPANWTKYMADEHPANAYYAEWIYKELMKLEKEHDLTPGDKTTPIFVGYRTLADRVNAARRGGGMDFRVAARIIKLLDEDVGLIRKVVKGRRGTGKKRRANGYIRVLPFPPLPNAGVGVPAGRQRRKESKTNTPNTGIMPAQPDQQAPAGTHTPANITHVSE